MIERHPVFVFSQDASRVPTLADWRIDVPEFDATEELLIHPRLGVDSGATPKLALVWGTGSVLSWFRAVVEASSEHTYLRVVSEPEFEGSRDMAGPFRASLIELLRVAGWEMGEPWQTATRALRPQDASEPGLASALASLEAAFGRIAASRGEEQPPEFLTWLVRYASAPVHRAWLSARSYYLRSVYDDPELAAVEAEIRRIERSLWSGVGPGEGAT